MPESRHIALTIAGGVSLGSFEAGALTELLYAVEALNARNRDTHYVIDVMTGGSAGSITSALAARAILHDRVRMSEALHDTWVRSVDIRGFIRNPDWNAILSSDVQRRLARRYFGADGAVPYVASPDALAPDQEHLSLGFSLSNMVGVDFGLPYAQLPGVSVQEQHFVSTFFSDFATFRIGERNRNDPATWSRIVNAAMASGSFPGAFSPVSVMRDARDYEGALAPPYNRFPAQMEFIDGGMFNNEPLRQAIHLASELDQDHPGRERLYLLVDPNLNRSARDERFLRPQGLADNLLRTIAMFAGEAAARDWLRVGRVNRELEWRDAAAEEIAALVAALPAGSIPARLRSLAPRIKAILEQKSRVEHRHLDDVYLHGRLERIRRRHVALTAALHGEGDEGDIRRDLFVRMMFVVDNAAGLNSKAPIELHAITTTPGETAGDPLHAFLGFFDQTWREHDYRLGRRIVRDRLPAILGVAPYPPALPEGFDGVANRNYDPDPEWGDLAAITPRDVDRETAQDVVTALVSRADRLMEQAPLEVNRFLRVFVRFFLERRLRRYFDL